MKKRNRNEGVGGEEKVLPELVNGIRLNNGKILEAKKISELTEYIVNKFADEKLSREEARLILENAKDTIEECAIVQKITSAL